jgi:hypothetical protein
MTQLNSNIRTEVIEVLADLSKMMVIMESHRDAIKESIKGLSDKTGISKKQLNLALKAYHKGQINETKEVSVETVDFFDFIFELDGDKE